ncbi:galactoside O-acetyltransferase [Limosilactobacillus frumenti DSM 13145]|uniref:Galactoside O-acetyltransferase n=1 Tax=Limosilactobacillus frumenti DSM 13145 TaxID=1423746 RepID=A0A0R1PCS4_9LACO|nr:DapH/DapD/GlmU-related protein [Limosilactobacillus frumenti]KRL27781.1 galactoside O-acetyltransferase [Limosilactobacillus frumenti DSM 13145]MBA2914415.1 sugar O-acetyltransferase [Limosilactobacillus frumenti]QFG73335.1 sugar O-acetyltransferase [Limosilactobacillus frumenti]
MTTTVKLNSSTGQEINQINTINQSLLQSLNDGQHSQAEVRELISQITKQTIDDSVEIRLPFYTDFGRNLHFGKNVFINSGVTFVDLGGIYLSDKVLIGPKANIISVNHPLDPTNRRNVELKPVYIHENAWIGANATVLPGVSIGRNAVVAAGAVVTKNVPANTVVAGVPARVIKKIK